MDQTDLQILDSVTAGDTDAYELIVRRYQGMVYDLAYRLLGDASEAEDAAQAAFIRMYSSLGSYKREMAFRNWAYTITLNVARNKLKRRNLLSFLPFLAGKDAEDAGGGVPEPAEAGGEPDAQLEGGRLRSDLEGAIGALPEDLRTPFVLFHLHRLPAGDIAETLGVTPNAVSLRLFKARGRLARALSPVYPEYNTEDI
ncbi:MAG: sigma-70 family RNA polymerase sigma factor [Elusimicrobiales bacterium]|nr:sigma-70 family RNA polymerase sigma factor [Elusimicrobiales bacterium]